LPVLSEAPKTQYNSLFNCQFHNTLFAAENQRQTRQKVAFWAETDIIADMDYRMLLELAEKLRSVRVADTDYQLSGLLGAKQKVEGQFDAPMKHVMVQLECDRRDGLSQRLKAEYEKLLQAAADFDNSCAIRYKTDLQKQLHLIAYNMVPAIAQDIATLIEEIAKSSRETPDWLNEAGTGSAESGQEEKAVNKPANAKTKKRPTKADMANRNKAVTLAAVQFKAKHDRLPTVDEIVDETRYSQSQVYATNAYKEGKIAKSSAKATAEVTGSSVQKSEYYSQKSEGHSRADRRAKSEQDELDVLIDKQKEDDGSDFVKK
jgi:hypothetical protein